MPRFDSNRFSLRCVFFSLLQFQPIFRCMGSWKTNQTRRDLNWIQRYDRWYLRVKRTETKKKMEIKKQREYTRESEGQKNDVLTYEFHFHKNVYHWSRFARLKHKFDQHEMIWMRVQIILITHIWFWFRFDVCFFFAYMRDRPRFFFSGDTCVSARQLVTRTIFSIWWADQLCENLRWACRKWTREKKKVLCRGEIFVWQV